MVSLFSALLFIFLVAYFGLDKSVVGGEIRVMNFSLAALQTQQFQVLLGGGIIFCEFAIILFSMLDRIVDTVREIIKPLARLIPLGAFLTAIYQTFKPLATIFLPTEITGMAQVEPSAYMANLISSGELTRLVLFTLGTMIFFIMANRALGTESAEVRALRAEVAKYRRVLK